MWFRSHFLQNQNKFYKIKTKNIVPDRYYFANFLTTILVDSVETLYSNNPFVLHSFIFIAITVYKY